MRVYIQKGKDNECVSPNFFIALDGFRQLGWEICYFHQAEELRENEPDDIIVGYLRDVKIAIQQLGIQPPEEINYPEELLPFLGRKVWKSTVNTIAVNPDLWNVFIKPAYGAKTFTGKLIKDAKDLIGCGHPLQDIDIWCSEPVHFLSEWRCFVRYNQIQDVRRYAGDWRLHFDYKILERALKNYTSAPKGFAMDFGLTNTGETLLVEINDGFSLGAYGLAPIEYAKLLSARWAEITKSTDYCAF